MGIVPYLPLWGEKQDRIVREFIDAGFEAVVVATKADLLGKEWLGRKLDSNFLADLLRLGNITPCGEPANTIPLLLTALCLTVSRNLGNQ